MRNAAKAPVARKAKAPQNAPRTVTKLPVARVGHADATGIDPHTVARLQGVAGTPDDRIKLADPDAPLTTDGKGAAQGKFFKPVKRLKSFRIDADVLAYFEGQGKGYQATVNRVLREAMLFDRGKSVVGTVSVKRQAKKT